jgi:hypothetical protein
MPLVAWIGLAGIGVVWAYLHNKAVAHGTPLPGPLPSAQLPPPPGIQFTFMPGNRYDWVFWVDQSETSDSIASALAHHQWVLANPPTLLGTSPVTPAWLDIINANGGAMPPGTLMNRWHVNGLYKGPIQSTDEADVIVESIVPGFI